MRGLSCALLILVGGCSRSSPTPSSADTLSCPDCNIVIISLTNVRRDHLGIYGYPRRTTPNIDGFFADGMVFESAFSPASWTLPVAASMYTSTFPTTHGVMSRYHDRLDDDVLTLTEILRNRGYATAAFTGGGDYNRKFNVAQGFDHYVDESSYAEFGIGFEAEVAGGRHMAYLGIERLIEPTVQWLKQHRRDKFFMHLQGYDAHCPFTPPAPFDTAFGVPYHGNVDYERCLWTFGRSVPVYRNGERVWPVKTDARNGNVEEIYLGAADIARMIALYDGAIASADFQLANLFAAFRAMGLEEKTIFIFMAEHGDLFGENGRFMRGGPLRGTFLDPVLSFPLLIKHPRVRTLISVPALVQTVDLLPTLLELVGVQDPASAQREGKSLLPVMRDPTREVNDHVYAASRYAACRNVLFSGTSVVESIRDRQWKLIREALYDAETGARTELTYELYDTTRDPAESQSVFFEQRQVADRLEKQLRKKFQDPFGLQAPPCP